MNDTVNHPEHYTSGSIECIDAIQASMSAEAFEGYCKGNAMKYIWRYKNKGKALEDLQKAQWYLYKLVSVQAGQALTDFIRENKEKILKITPVNSADEDDEPHEKTYYDIVAEKWPEQLPYLACNGEMYCPSRFFEDAEKMPCGCAEDCKECWGQLYDGEEIIFKPFNDPAPDPSYKIPIPEKKEDYKGKSYRDVVAEKWPGELDRECGGGVIGCPKNYFLEAGFDETTCMGTESGKCDKCWSQPYRGEEIIYGGGKE
jgi:hypothetical protein